MIKRIYRMEELTESAELLRAGPPWWVHVVLFGLIFVLLASVTIITAVLKHRLRGRAGAETTQVSVSARMRSV
jgi:hypothetical protein